MQNIILMNFLLRATKNELGSSKRRDDENDFINYVKISSPKADFHFVIKTEPISLKFFVVIAKTLMQNIIIIQLSSQSHRKRATKLRSHEQQNNLSNFRPNSVVRIIRILSG